VAADSRSARDGRFLEKLGYYNPLPDPVEVHLEVQRIREWVTKGARLSESVTQLLRQVEKQVGSKATEETKSDT
jgi:small subunit ribosomal protein S16